MEDSRSKLENESNGSACYGNSTLLRKHVVDILGNMDSDELNGIISLLEKLGVINITDLEWVEHEDLKALRPVHARKLLRSFRKKGPVAASATSTYSDQGSSGCEFSSTVTTPAQSPASSVSDSPAFMFSPEPISCTMDPNWPVRMTLPWESLNTLTKEALETGKRLSPAAKKELVHTVVDAVRAITRHATRSQFCTISQRMIAKYTKSLQDQLEGSVCGSGYETLLNKLVSRNQNLNRPEPSRMGLNLSAKKRPRSETNEEEQPDCSEARKRRDSYGCVASAWSPEVGGDTTEMEQTRDNLKETHSTGADPDQLDMKMKSTYPLQRQDINSGMLMEKLKEAWPYLFTTTGLLNHSYELLGHDVRKELSSAYVKKAPRLNNFLRKTEGNAFIFTEAQRQSDQDNMKAWLSAVILCVLKRLGENEEELFYVVDETSTPGEIQSNSKTESPVLVVFGDSVLSGRSFTVMCDHVILCPRSDSFIDTFSAFFACFYIFNLEYPHGAASTLEFIQRCFVGINPDRGSKGNKGRKKKTSMSPKVLKLINDLSDFEWLQS